jgi:hypothetical protein
LWVLLILRGLDAAIPCHAMIGGGADPARTANLLKLKVIACMKAEN